MLAPKATILFAEDDSSLAFIVKDCLEDEGYKVVHCADGQTAIDNFDKAIAFAWHKWIKVFHRLAGIDRAIVQE